MERLQLHQPPVIRHVFYDDGDTNTVVVMQLRTCTNIQLYSLSHIKTPIPTFCLTKSQSANDVILLSAGM